MNARAVNLVSADDLEEYPISSKDRLDSHYFLQWNLKRWRGSEFRKTVDPEAGWYGFGLFCIAQDGTPIGTLPVDDQQLAFDLNLPLEKWVALMARKVTPLHNWHRVRCDNGEIRYAHPVVTEVALEALASKRAASERAQQRRDAKRLKDLAGHVERIGAKHLLKLPGFIDRLDAHLNETHRGNRTEAAVRAALDVVGQ